MLWACICVCGSAVRDRVRPWLDALKEVKRYASGQEWARELGGKLNEDEREKNAKWGARGDEGKATLNQAPFNQRALTIGDIKITRQREPPVGSPGRLTSQIYGKLGRVLSTMFKPQRHAPGDRDYSGKAVSARVVNLSGGSVRAGGCVSLSNFLQHQLCMPRVTVYSQLYFL